MFSGSIPALVTPFIANKLDEGAFRDFLEWQVTEGSHALVACGTTGESATLTDAEHRRVIELTLEVANGRVPVIAGCGANDTEHAVALTRTAQELGAAAAPSCWAVRVRATACSVSLAPQPAITGTRPLATSRVSSITRRCSASLSVADSPVVPQATRAWLPCAICHSRKSQNAASSTAPAVNGVTSAGIEPENMDCPLTGIHPAMYNDV